MNDNTIKALAGIGGVVILEVAALMTGHNGTMLLASIAIVSGIAGYAVRGIIKSEKGTGGVTYAQKEKGLA